MNVLLLAALLAVAGPNELREAVKANDTVRVRTLLNSGIDPNFRDPLGATLLHDAAWNGNEQVAELLLEYRADANARHLEAGSPPLSFTVIKDHPEMGSLLLAHGADVKLTYGSGATALHL